MDRPPIDGLITFVYTTDLARSADFYERMLRLPLTLDQGRCRIYHVAGSAYVGVCERAACDIQLPPPDKRTVILTLVVPDVDAWFEHLGALGVDFESPPQFNVEYGIYHVFLRDPSGYLVEIQRFEDPRWREQARQGPGSS